MVFDPRFVVLFTIVSLVIVTAGIMLPKMWRRTPDGFKPIVRISGLDKLQAWSLHRSALRLEAEGKERPAIMAWERAVANDPCDLELARGNLRAIIKWDKRNEFRPSALGQGLWLLRIGQTNMADVELMTRLCRSAKGEVVPGDQRPAAPKLPSFSSLLSNRYEPVGHPNFASHG